MTKKSTKKTQPKPRTRAKSRQTSIPDPTPPVAPKHTFSYYVDLATDKVVWDGPADYPAHWEDLVNRLGLQSLLAVWMAAEQAPYPCGEGQAVLLRFGWIAGWCVLTNGGRQRELFDVTNDDVLQGYAVSTWFNLQEVSRGVRSLLSHLRLLIAQKAHSGQNQPLDRYLTLATNGKAVY